MKPTKADSDGQYYDPKDLEWLCEPSKDDPGFTGPKPGSIPIDQPNNCGCFAEEGYPCPHEVEDARNS